MKTLLIHILTIALASSVSASNTIQTPDEPEFLSSIKYEIYMNAIPELEFILTDAPEVSAVEAWMFEPVITPANEAELNIENWMFEPVVMPASETEISLEDWMLSDDYFTAEEMNTPLESWMFSDNHFSEEDTPVVEDWMLDPNHFTREGTL